MSKVLKRIRYWRRIFKVYLSRDKGYLSFWHEKPAISEGITPEDILGPYYMTFADKADYAGPKDERGVILFDYFFDIGRQYNPLAIAQYGLGHYNKHQKIRSKKQGIKDEGQETEDNTREGKHFEISKTQADWLVDNLEKNEAGLFVWKHKFKWHYKEWLEPGWYSAHAQGTGISLLARMYKKTNDVRYLEAAKKAFIALNTDRESGGVKFTDKEGNVWLEEYIIKQPTHILNGFLWALWGVWDYWLLTGDEKAKKLFRDCVETLKKNLPRYDAGFWSLYDLSRQKMKMLASPFYHDLHIVQLMATYILSENPVFKTYAEKFQNYKKSRWNRIRALTKKALFKLFYF